MHEKRVPCSTLQWTGSVVEFRSLTNVSANLSHFAGKRDASQLSIRDVCDVNLLQPPFENQRTLVYVLAANRDLIIEIWHATGVSAAIAHGALAARDRWYIRLTRCICKQ